MDVIRGGIKTTRFGVDRPDLLWEGAEMTAQWRKAMDAFEWSQGKILLKISDWKDRLTGFSDKPAIKNKGDKHVIIKDLGAKFILNNVDFKEFISHKKMAWSFFNETLLKAIYLDHISKKEDPPFAIISKCCLPFGTPSRNWSIVAFTIGSEPLDFQLNDRP